MSYDSLQRYTQVHVPSIAYSSAGDCSFREDSQSKHPVRMQFFRVREPPLVHKRPIPHNTLRPARSKGQRLTVGGDEACAYVNSSDAVPARKTFGFKQQTRMTLWKTIERLEMMFYS